MVRHALGRSHDATGGLYDRLSVAGAAATDHERWASLDTLRAIAALMVLTAHARFLGMSSQDKSLTAQVFDAFASGVWLFFALSGFLIGGPFLQSLLGIRPRPRTARYAVRRAARILPAYWVAFAVILIGATGSAIAHWWQVPVHALLLHGFVPGESQKLFFVAWTLASEAIFYALMPLGTVLLLALWRRRGGVLSLDGLARVILGLWAASVLWGIALAVLDPFSFGDHPSKATSVGVIAIGLGNFCPGLLVFLASTEAAQHAGGWWARYRRVVSRPGPTLLAVLALVVIVQVMPAGTSSLAFVLFHPLIGIASGLVLGVTLAGTRIKPLARVLAPVGLISYGVYLWHWVILTAMQSRHLRPLGKGGPLPAVIHVVILAALTLPVALASWLLIERPLLRRTTQWDTRRAPRRATESSGALASAGS